MQQPYAHPPGEVVFLESPDVRVSNTRATISGTTYALANITSVRGFVEPKGKLPLILGVPSLALGLVMLTGTPGGGTVFLILFGAVMIGAYAGLMKHRYWVALGTAGAETNAIYFHRPEDAHRLVDALNHAIAHRG